MAIKPPSFKQLVFLPDIAGIFGLFAFVVSVLFNKGKSLVDGDTFWHLAAGKYMLESGTILTHDVFSHTAFSKLWISHEWLSEIIMAWLHQHFDLAGTTIFFFFIVALSFWLLFRIVSTIAGDWIATFAVSLALVFSMPHMLVRPHVFTWLFGIITLYALNKQGRWYWLLPPLIALWCNLHGGFILGLALQGLFIGGTILDGFFSQPRTNLLSIFSKVKRPAIFFCLSILITGINPSGFRLLLFPFMVHNTIISNNIMEWMPTNLHQEWPFRFFLLFILLLMSLKYTPTNWTDRLFILFFFNISFMYRRYMGMASIFLSPYFAIALKSVPWRQPKPLAKLSGHNQLQTSVISGPVMMSILALGLIFLAGPAHPNTSTLLDAFFPLPEDKHPIEATKFLNKTRPPGKMFNKYSWGGYLIYALDPAQKVFIDGRADMYGEEIIGDYLKIISLDKDTEELLNRYGIDWIIFQTDSVLIRYLRMTGKWQEIYSDDVASILVRRVEISP